MKKSGITLWGLTVLLLFSLSAIAQDGGTSAAKEAAYTKTITQRSAKIVDGLQLGNAKKAARVQAVIVQQYRDLNAIYTIRDSMRKEIKSAPGGKEADEARAKALEAETTRKLDRLHQSYFSKLTRLLTPEQVDQVKNAMTYNVLPITYKAYQEMLPTLTEKQKAQLLAWLTEAREHAVDAESAEKKHAWFGKYKGRINNYLSSEGYDMKKSGEEWQERIKAEQQKK